MADATYAMQQVVTNGSGKTAQGLGRPVAAKTGSSSDNKSAQFVGYTPQIATAVTLYQTGDDGSEESITPWGEYDEITGSTYPADIFTEYMSTALKDLPVEDFPDRTNGSYQRGSLHGTAMPVEEDYSTPEPRQQVPPPATTVPEQPTTAPDQQDPGRTEPSSAPSGQGDQGGNGGGNGGGDNGSTPGGGNGGGNGGGGNGGGNGGGGNGGGGNGGGNGGGGGGVVPGGQQQLPR